MWGEKNRTKKKTGASSASTGAAEKLISTEKCAFPLYWVLIVAPPLHRIVRMRRGGEKQKGKDKKREGRRREETLGKWKV